eukprot:3079097-Prymnesium_polylepis.2
MAPVAVGQVERSDRRIRAAEHAPEVAAHGACARREVGVTAVVAGCALRALCGAHLGVAPWLARLAVDLAGLWLVLARGTRVAARLPLR